ncbi:hypothetical protein AC578_7748 [Pseudocercospora eumusae]|uniref:Uncharacterized protein n=1 Tax=Pseudocercospora eumusae TaxID=321146 RepID=A0A139HLB5_9PEZI|nr:hypothetical protein AC578_7748 [Pseudocercospora eumusae]
MTSESSQEPRRASTKARKRIRDQYDAFPEVGHAEVEDNDGEYQPRPKRVRTQASGDDEPIFDDEAYRRANAQEGECPPWHPSMPQPDEDDEEFKPVLDQNGDIVESIENEKASVEDKKSSRMQELVLKIEIERIRLSLKELELERIRLGNMEDDMQMGGTGGGR